jgi:hypothetical protein
VRIVVLNILASLKEVTVESCAVFDSDKPVQKDEVVLGVLSGRALNLWAYMGEQWRGFVNKKAEVLEVRAVAIRSRSEADIVKATQVIIEFERLGSRLNELNQLFRLEIAEEFNVDLDWCVGVRKGFKAVKYKGPPADRGMTIIESVEGVE